MKKKKANSECEVIETFGDLERYLDKHNLSMGTVCKRAGKSWRAFIFDDSGDDGPCWDGYGVTLLEAITRAIQLWAVSHMKAKVAS